MAVPSFPHISFLEAIRRIRDIYEAEGTHSASVGALIKDLGYSGPTNGAAKTVMGSLNKYNLLTRVSSGEYKLSETALDILLHESGSFERENAVLKTAFAPELFQELFEEFGDSLPSENNLTARLVKRGLNPKQVPEIIKNYKVSLELANAANKFLSSSLPVPTAIETKEEVAESSLKKAEHRENTSVSANFSSGELTALSFPVSPKNNVKVIFEGTITIKTVRSLIKHLELLEENYFEEEIE